MAHTTKPFSEYDLNQIHKKVYNETGTLGVDGFVAGKVNNKITQSISTTTVTGDTLTFNFFEQSSILLMTFVVIYTDNTYSTLLSVERTF